MILLTCDDVRVLERSLFLKEGAKASTRTLAKMAGISEAVIFQRFGTKKDLFFAAMILPKVQLETMFNVQPGKKQVKTNLQSIRLRIVADLREVMPIFLSLISHPSFDRQTFLQRHTMPMAQIEHELTAYVTAETDLGRIHLDNIVVSRWS